MNVYESDQCWSSCITSSDGKRNNNNNNNDTLWFESWSYDRRFAIFETKDRFTGSRYETAHWLVPHHRVTHLSTRPLGQRFTKTRVHVANMHACMWPCLRHCASQKRFGFAINMHLSHSTEQASINKKEPRWCSWSEWDKKTSHLKPQLKRRAQRVHVIEITA